MSVVLVFGVAESPKLQYRADVPRNVLQSSTFCTDMLENVGSEEQPIVLPIPFVSNPSIARVLVAFLLKKDVALAQQPPKAVFEIMLAANGMHMQELLDKTIDIIAGWWGNSSIEEIRAQWGFADNLSAEKKARIANETHVLFRFQNKTIETQQRQEGKWDWPVELLTLVMEKLSTRELARAQAICVECFNIIHYRLAPRGDVVVRLSNDGRFQEMALDFAERHATFFIDQPREVDMLLMRKSKFGSSPRAIKIWYRVDISAEKIRLLGQLNDLRRLDWLGENKLDESKLQALATLSQLTHLAIKFDHSCRGGAKFLHPLSNLKWLFIHDENKLGAEGAKWLSKLFNLEDLIIRADNDIGAEGARFLSNLPNLQFLSIGERNKIGAEGAAFLAELSNLQRLVIGSENDIGAEGAIFLAELFNLKWLVIGSKNDIGARGAASWKKLSKLEGLEIGDENAIGEEGARAIASLSNLKTLRIGNGNNIGTKSASCLGDLSKLQTATIGSKNNIGLEGGKALATLPALQHLEIWSEGNNIGLKEAHTLKILPGSILILPCESWKDELRRIEETCVDSFSANSIK